MLRQWRRPKLLVISVVLASLPLLAVRAQNVPFAPALSSKSAGPLSARLAALTQELVSIQAVQAHGRHELQHRQHASLARRLSLPAQGYGSLVETSSGHVLVYVHVMSADQTTLARLVTAGAQLMQVSQRYGTITASIAVHRLAAVAAVPGVRSIQEALAPMRQRSDPALSSPIRARAGQEQPVCSPGARVSEGDKQLQAAAARAQFGVDGSGVTVGVLSGSYDVATETAIHAQQDIASGDLPGPGNPCGRSSAVQVVAETRLGAGRDEGRAMLQIVHDLAPGARLAFATAEDGLFAFAENIRRLRNEARADVLVDDYYYPEEPFFQDGPITVAINDVTAAGAIYVTAGGNTHLEDTAGNAIGSYETPAYRPVQCPMLVDPATGNPFTPGADCHDYNAGAGIDPGIDITLPSGGSLTTNFQWSEPWFGVQTDLDIYLTDERNQVVAQSANVIGLAPFEFLGYDNTQTTTQTLRLVVARFTGAQPRFKFTLGSANIYAIPPSSLEYAGIPSIDIIGPTVTDHAAAARAITVAAVPYDDATRVERFSSRGPVTIDWAPTESIRPAARLAVPEVRAKPDIAATNGVQTTFYRRRSLTSPDRCDPALPDDICRFFGTSAAAPHVAAVMALMQQHSRMHGGVLDQQRGAELLKQHALPMMLPSETRGAGLVNALGAVKAAGVVVVPAQRMPDMLGASEAAARDALARRGVALTQLVVDYQDRAKLGMLFDQTPAFTVVSTMPAANTVLVPGQTVVLGVRAAEDAAP